MDVEGRKDLVVLVADKNAEFALRGILARHPSLRIRALQFDVYVHPERDPGCRAKCHEFLQSFAGAYAHALVLFDREGCGREDEATGALEAEVRQSLSRSGWGNRAEVIVLEPELDVWVWSDSPHVDDELGWKGRHPGLRAWLAEKGYLRSQEDKAKPARPKEAMEAALRAARKPRSSVVYQRLAEKLSLSRCRDPGFLRLASILRTWFSAARL